RRHRRPLSSSGRTTPDRLSRDRDHPRSRSRHLPRQRPHPRTHHRPDAPLPTLRPTARRPPTTTRIVSRSVITTVSDVSRHHTRGMDAESLTTWTVAANSGEAELVALVDRDEVDVFGVPLDVAADERAVGQHLPAVG